MNVLVVEDIEDARIILMTALEDAGYGVEEASNGVQAVERLHLVRPDLIISDILMPEMDGFGLCRVVKSDPNLRNIPFILYTATFVEPKDERMAMALGACRFIVKPIETGEFIKMVEEVLKEYEDDKLLAPERLVKDAQVPGSVVTFVDITERKQAEEALIHLNRVLRTISKCNEVLIHATDESALLQDLCKVIVEEGQYCLAWVGYAEHDDINTVRPVAQAGNEDGYLETLTITCADTERGRGPTGTAIRTGKPSVVKDFQSEDRFAPWRAGAVERGYASTIAFPLVVDGRVLGALTIYASVLNAFDEEEIKLLNELAANLAYGIATLRARTAKEQADEVLRQANVVVENSPTVLFRWKAEPGWPVDFVSRNVIQFGISAQDLLSGAVCYSDLVHPDDRGRLEHALSDYAKREINQFTEEHRIVTPSREVRWVEIHARIERDSQGRVDHYQGIAIDITERKGHMAELQHIALYDSLTGLPNRSLLQNRLEQAIHTARREGHVVALIVLNLARFKEINDTLGYHNGDRVLQEVGKRLKAELGKLHTVARLNGNEFAVVLSAARIEYATQTIRKLEDIMEAPFLIDDTPIHIEIQAGIALYPDHAEESEVLIKRANVALRLAEAAKSNFTVYVADRDPFNLRRLTLFGELRQAISQGELTLHYQAKVDVKTSRVVSAEALARWPHSQEGMISPGEFIPLAEHTGLIRPLTFWVFNTAVRQCQAWGERGVSITIAVNLSARNLQDPRLPDWLSECLQRFGVSPDRLMLEITESALMYDPERALDVSRRLKEMGLSLSIDDFGSGYSSLAYLRKLPVDELKVDRSFVSDMTKNENDKVIVRSTIDLAHNLGLKVVAEGVEDRDTLEQLADLGCDVVQGYYINRPVAAGEFMRWLHESSYS